MGIIRTLLDEVDETLLLLPAMRVIEGEDQK
jgi:hypothetical protein